MIKKWYLNKTDFNALRELKFVTMEEISDETGIALNTLYRMQRGLKVRKSTIKKVASFLNVNYDRDERGIYFYLPDKKKKVFDLSPQREDIIRKYYIKNKKEFKDLCFRQKLNFVSLARLAKIERKTLYRMFEPDVMPRFDTINAISNALGIPYAIDEKGIYFHLPVNQTKRGQIMSEQSIFVFEPAPIEELLNEARRWRHEIKKINMENARNMIAFFQVEMPQSETVARLSLAVNQFYVHPTPVGRDRMYSYADELVNELEAELQTKQGAMQGA